MTTRTRMYSSLNEDMDQGDDHQRCKQRRMVGSQKKEQELFLPNELLSIVLTFTDENTSLNFILTCRTLYQIFQQLMKDSIYDIRTWYLNRRQLDMYENINHVTLEDRVINSRLIDLYSQKILDLSKLPGKKGQKCCSTLEEFKSSFHLLCNCNGQNDGKNSIIKYVLEELFERNKTNKQQFVVAGGSILSSLRNHNSQKKIYYTNFTPLDIDIFLVENGMPKEESDKLLKSVLLSVEDRIKSDKKVSPFIVCLHSSTLCIVNKYDYPDVQIILRRIESIEELLLFFDLDASRFSFDGKKVWTTIEGLRSLKHEISIVPSKHKQSGMYFKRAVKYSSKGFQTSFYNLEPLNFLRTSLSLPENLLSNPGAYFSEEHELSGSLTEDDLNMYSNLNRIPYCDLLKIYQEGLDNYKGWAEDSYGGDVELDVIAPTLEKAHFTIAMSFSELYQLDRSRRFVEHYKDSHLNLKYSIKKCYLCHLYRELPNSNDEDSLCDSCSAFNSFMRNTLQRDLTGFVAIVTGGRIKIGKAIVLKLLRSNATVVTTTRFASIAMEKYQEEKDFDIWKDRLIIYALDLKSAMDIHKFIDFIKSRYERIHILVNNAAQTVRRPLAYYKELIAKEKAAIRKEETTLKAIESKGKSKSSKSSVMLQPFKTKEWYQLKKKSLETTLSYLSEQDPSNSQEIYFPPSKKDQFGEPLDMRPKNTWNQPLEEISTMELVEVQMINNIAPNMLLSNLMDLLKLSHKCEMSEHNKRKVGASTEKLVPSYVVNVTSHEGQFNTEGKTSYHIHTNMSKAALNMLTRSCADRFAKYGILVNSCDPGWVSSSVQTFSDPTLSCEDGATRVLYPILSDTDEFGKLFKDYRVVPW